MSKGYNGIDVYLEQISRYPVLSTDEEIELGFIARDGETESVRQQAKNKLVESNLKFVVSIAKKFANPIPLMDLVQEGNAGLIHAASKYDPNKGFRFVSYARFWIRQRMRVLVLTSHSLIKIPDSNKHRRMFFSMSKIKDLSKIRDQISHSSEKKKLASKLNVTVKELTRFQEVLMWPQLSVSMSVSNKKGDETEPGDIGILSDKFAGVNKAEEVAKVSSLAKKIEHSMSGLTDRQKDVISSRWLKDEPVMYQVIADKYGVTRQAIRQQEDPLLKKMKNILEPDFSSAVFADLSS